MPPPSLKPPIAIVRAKAKRVHISQKPQKPIDVISEFSKACLSAIVLFTLVISATALFALAGVGIRSLVALW